MKAIDVVELIKTTCSDVTSGVVIVGGYARDMYFGITPKDIDVCVVPVGHHKEFLHKAKSVLSQFLVNFEVFAGYASTNNQQFDEMLFCVLRAYAEDMQVDFLISKLPSVQAYVDAFDYNLNQYVAVGFGNKLIPLYAGEDDNDITVCRELINLRTDTVPERKAKMQAKWECIKEQL